MVVPLPVVMVGVTVAPSSWRAMLPPFTEVPELVRVMSIVLEAEVRRPEGAHGRGLIGARDDVQIIEELVSGGTTVTPTDAEEPADERIDRGTQRGTEVQVFVGVNAVVHHGEGEVGVELNENINVVASGGEEVRGKGGGDLGASDFHVNVGTVIGTVLVGVELDGEAAAVAFLGRAPISSKIEVGGEVKTEAVAAAGAAADSHFEAGGKANDRGAGIEIAGDDEYADLAAAGVGDFQTAAVVDSAGGVNEPAAVGAVDGGVGGQAGVEIGEEASRLGAKRRG